MNGSARGRVGIGRIVRDFSLVSIVALAIGGTGTILFLWEAGAARFADLEWHAHAAAFLVAVAGCSVVNLTVRFVRWQYLLRRNDVFVPARDSARLYLSALALLLTPLYLGEIIYKAVLLRRLHGIRTGTAAAVALSERLYDAAALAAIGGIAGLWTGRGSGLLLAAPLALLLPQVRRAVAALAAWPVMALGRLLFNADTRPAQTAMRRVTQGGVAAVAFLLTLAAWLPAVLSLHLIGQAVGAPAGTADAARLFSSGALLGGVLLSPGGVVIAGQTILEGLRDLGVAEGAAIATVFLVRLATLGFAVLLGFAMMLWTAWRGEFADRSGEAHFERLGEVYDAEIPDHVREHVVAKKIEHMRGETPPAPALGLDVGCGKGYYLDTLAAASRRVVGVDLSHAQLRGGRTPGRVAVADVLQLPFADRTFDFAYSVNLFHHLGSAEQQRRAFAEIRRVLETGALFHLHEINVTNPIFRFYMGYLFPLLRNIDRGTEQWLLPARMDDIPGMRLRRIESFTFIPDFAPRWAVARLVGLERRLERSRWARYGAHFVAVLEKVDGDR